MAGNGSGVLKLSNENYEVWRILMLALFVRKGVKDVAIGDVEWPLTSPNLNAGKAWQRKNDEALAEMILNVEVNQLAHMTSDIALKVWEELKKDCTQHSRAARLHHSKWGIHFMDKPWHRHAEDSVGLS
ncbi:hypothetical protein EDD85DRAFT_798619 [Armillaria nabsnona]|nr:hypothetical protein EDD85DRAFT_798619 [Armillaria nabsnona]